MSNNFKYTKTRHTWVIEIQCVPCSTLSTAAEAIQSQQSVSAAVEGEGDALLLQTQSSNPTFLPEVLGHYRSEHHLLQTLLWRQILHHHGLIVRFSTQHISAAGISGHRALYLLFASVISEYNQTPGWKNSRIEVPEHLCNLSTLCPLYQADLPSMILMPLTMWNTTEHCLTAPKPSLCSSEFSWFIKQKGWARGNKCDVPG